MAEDEVGQALGPLLIEIAPRVTHLVRHALRQVEPQLTYAQYRALLHIDQGKTTLSALRSPATLALSTLSEIVDALVKRGLVARVPSERDRRSFELSLTEQGSKALDDANERLGTLADRLTAEVPAAARAWLADTLRPVNATAEAALVDAHNRPQ